jgi:hypothetical protein
MSTPFPFGKKYIDALLKRAQDDYILDTPPVHTIPPWCPHPRRQVGIAPAAALSIRKQPKGITQYSCTTIPGANDWHRPANDYQMCRDGIVIVSPWKVTLPLVVIDKKGSGCNNTRGGKCSSTYMLPYELEEGVNVLSWCDLLAIHSSERALIDHLSDVQHTTRGPTLFMPKMVDIRFERYDWDHQQNKYILINPPQLMDAMRGYWVQPAVAGLVHEEDNGTLDPMSFMVATIENLGTRKDPTWLEATMIMEDTLLHVPRDKWHFSALEHKLQNKHIWPKRCFCGQTETKGQWVDFGGKIFQPSHVLRAYLGYPPHQVVDEDGRFQYTMKEAIIWIKQKKPIAIAVPVPVKDEEEDSDEGASTAASAAPLNDIEILQEVIEIREPEPDIILVDDNGDEEEGEQLRAEDGGQAAVEQMEAADGGEEEGGGAAAEAAITSVCTLAQLAINAVQDEFCEEENFEEAVEAREEDANNNI